MEHNVEHRGQNHVELMLCSKALFEKMLKIMLNIVLTFEPFHRRGVSKIEKASATLGENQKKKALGIRILIFATLLTENHLVCKTSRFTAEPLQT